MDGSPGPAPTEPSFLEQATRTYQSDVAKETAQPTPQKALMKLPPLAPGGTGADIVSRVPSSEIAGVFTRVPSGEALLQKQKLAEAGVGERIVGLGSDIPFEGMRVVLRRQALIKFPDLKAQSGGGFGTVTVVSSDQNCTVVWDNGVGGAYSIGCEGEYRLAVAWADPNHAHRGRESMAGSEEVVGIDVPPAEGMRVVLRQSFLEENPELWEDCGKLASGERGVGTITWVDPDDADGDGVPGDIVEVLWDITCMREDYRTGFEGCFRLALHGPPPPSSTVVVARVPSEESSLITRSESGVTVGKMESKDDLVSAVGRLTLSPPEVRGVGPPASPNPRFHRLLRVLLQGNSEGCLHPRGVSWPSCA